jgi:hypothetical protein
MRRHLPVSLVIVRSVVTNVLLFDHGLNLLKDVGEVEWVKLGHLVDALMRNNDEIRASLPRHVKVRQATLVVQMS